MRLLSLPRLTPSCCFSFSGVLITSFKWEKTLEKSISSSASLASANCLKFESEMFSSTSERLRPEFSFMKDKELLLPSLASVW